jgi:hypothetical protein
MSIEKRINVETVNRCATLPPKGSADGAERVQIAELNLRLPAHKGMEDSLNSRHSQLSLN